MSTGRGSGRGGAGLPAERGGADPHRTHRRHHRAGRPVARRSCPPAAAGAAQRTAQPDHGAGLLRRLAEHGSTRRPTTGRRCTWPWWRWSPTPSSTPTRGRRPGPSSSTRAWERRQRDVPDHRPRHLAAARPGRRGPRPRPDGGRARRGQAAGQPPGREAGPGDDGDAAAPAAPARRAGLGPPGRARRVPGRAAVHRGYLHHGGQPRPGRWSAARSTSAPPTCWAGGCYRSAGAARSRW